VVFHRPEVAWCGLTEAEAEQKGIEVKVAKFPWAASGRALSFDRTDGLTKLVIDPETERLLGVGIVGHGAGELIAEGVVAIEMGGDSKDLALCVHPHPTLSGNADGSRRKSFTVIRPHNVRQEQTQNKRRIEPAPILPDLLADDKTERTDQRALSIRLFRDSTVQHEFKGRLSLSHCASRRLARGPRYGHARCSHVHAGGRVRPEPARLDCPHRSVLIPSAKTSEHGNQTQLGAIT